LPIAPAAVVETKPAPKVAEPAPLAVEASKATSPKVATPEPAGVTPPPVAEQPKVIVEPAVPELAPVASDPAPAVVEPAPVAVEPAPVAVESAPVAAEPLAPNPFDAPAAKAPVDDLFGDTPAADAPAAKAPVDDLFGDTPAAKAPAVEPDVPAVPPAKIELDDLFGNQPAPKSTLAEPSIEDLFGSDPKPAAPATGAPVESKPTEDIDDLFNTKEKPVAAPDSSIDDLFGKPIGTEVRADQPMPSAEIIEEDKFIDSLFGKTPVTSAPAASKPRAPESTIEKPLTPAPAVREPAGSKEPVVDELDALFGVGAYTPASEFNGAEYRLWVDNSGAYQIKGRLAVIYVDKVKLLKENGKFTTVPLSRLSDADFGYVSWVASNLTNEQTARMVKTESQSTDTDAR